MKLNIKCYNNYNLLMAILFVLIIIIFGVFLIKEIFNENNILIKVYLDRKLMEKGYIESIERDKIIAEINTILLSSSINEEEAILGSELKLLSRERQINIQLAMINNSFEEIIMFLKKIFGKEIYYVDVSYSDLGDSIKIMASVGSQEIFKNNIKKIILNKEKEEEAAKLVTFHIMENIMPSKFVWYLMDNDRKEALRVIKVLLSNKVNKKRGNYLNTYGIILDVEGKHDDAICIYKMGLKYSSHDRELMAMIVNNWGVALSNKKEIEKSIIKYKEAIEIYGESGHPYVNLGSSYSDKGEKLKAVDTFKEALEKMPMKPVKNYVYKLASESFIKLEMYNDAVSLFEEWEKYYNIGDKGYYNWGIALEEIGLIEESIEKYRIAKIFYSGNIKEKDINNKIEILSNKLK